MEILNDKCDMFTYNNWQDNKKEIVMALPRNLEDHAPVVFRFTADKGDKEFVNGMIHQFKSYYSILHNGGNQFQLTDLQRKMVDFAEDSQYDINTMLFKDYERLKEIKYWRLNGVEPCNCINIGDNQVIALCGVEQGSDNMKKFIANEQQKLDAAFKKLLDKKRYASEVWKSKEWKETVDTLQYNLPLNTFSNIMRMTAKEYQRENNDIAQAKHHLSIEKEQKKFIDWGLEYGDRYVIWIQDLHKINSSIMAIKESEIRDAENLETAAMWYDYGKEAVKTYADTGMIHKVEIDNASGPLVRIFTKEADKRLDGVFNRKWDRVLANVLKEKGMTREEYFKNR